MTFEGQQIQGAAKILEKLQVSAMELVSWIWFYLRYFLQGLTFQKISRALTAVDSQPMFDGGVLINVLGRLQVSMTRLRFWHGSLECKSRTNCHLSFLILCVFCASYRQISSMFHMSTWKPLLPRNLSHKTKINKNWVVRPTTTSLTPTRKRSCWNRSEPAFSSSMTSSD